MCYDDDNFEYKRDIEYMKPKSSRQTRTNIKTSTSRSATRSKSTSKTRRGGDETRRGGKKPKKQDNTKLFIGVGVGVFMFLIIIIAAASSGGEPSGGSTTTAETKKSKFLLPLNVRKQIYSEYVAASIRFEDESRAELAALPDNERREKGPQVRRNKTTKENNFRVKLSSKYRKKYPKATGSFVKKIVDEGDDKNWR